MAFKVHYKKWHTVAEWRWIVNDENCGICRNAFDACPPNVKYPGDDCPPVWGKCGHAFHLQCINEWLNKENQTCPMCRQEWEFKAERLDDD